MAVKYSVFWILFSLSDAAITGTPPNVNLCDGEFANLKWAYDTTNLFAVEWKINGTLMLQYIPSQPINSQYTYSNGYTSAKLTHIANGEINITSLNTNDNGNYSCQTTYTSGSPSTFETQMVLTIYDMISTNLTCSYNQSADTIDCSVNIPSSITAVTINGADNSALSWPISGTKSETYTVCMKGNAANCRIDGIQQCISFKGRDSLSTTTVGISTDSTYEQTTNAHRHVELLSRSIKTTVDKTTEDVYSTIFQFEQSKITYQTTYVSNGESVDKHLLLTTKVLTFSICGALCLVSIIIIFRVVHRTHLRRAHGDDTVSNTGRHILNNKHLDNNKTYESRIHCCGVKKTISEMTETKPIWERNNSQLKFENVYQGHRGYVSTRTYYTDYQISPSGYSRRQEADLKGYVFYQGKI